jgi:hypothetical protein
MNWVSLLCLNEWLSLLSVIPSLNSRVRNRSNMGRTIPSFKIGAEKEWARWRPFWLSLNKKDRKLFDEMLSYVRLNNSACMMAARLSCLLSHYINLISIMFSQVEPEVRKRINLGNVVASVEHNRQRWLHIQSRVQR